jgi:hypothetical protein
MEVLNLVEKKFGTVGFEKAAAVQMEEEPMFDMN